MNDSVRSPRIWHGSQHGWRTAYSSGRPLAALALIVAVNTPLVVAGPPIAIKAEKAFVGDGQTVEQAIILIKDGKIVAVGKEVAIPEGTSVIEVAGGTVTPGLIDANSRIENTNLFPASHKAIPQGGLATGWHDEASDNDHSHSSDFGEREDPHSVASPQSSARDEYTAPVHVDPMHLDPMHLDPMHLDPMHLGDDHLDDELPLAVGVRSSTVVNEQSSEVVPHIRVVDDLNLRARDFDRLVRGGVTTVYASPDAAAVIGARGAVLHTGGPAARRVLIPAAAVKATIGTDPSYFGSYNRSPSRHSTTMYTRRPNSRMGLTWVFRKAFYDAQRRDSGRVAYGADTASAEATNVLKEVLDGKVPLRIQARIQQDILTALRLADEFDLDFVLEEATEAYLCVDELKAHSVPVIFGPIFETPRGSTMRRMEGRRSRYFTLEALLEVGIPTALSAQELREDDGLARQAMYAMRFGASLDAALRAVTLTPAQMLGLDEQIGTVEAGKRADLVIWQGAPFEATSSVKVVLIDGDVVFDRR
ncbi:MAG: amidohydrolase family protein [Pirellulaceae bacterium]